MSAAHNHQRFGLQTIKLADLLAERVKGPLNLDARDKIASLSAASNESVSFHEKSTERSRLS